MVTLIAILVTPHVTMADEPGKATVIRAVDFVSQTGGEVRVRKPKGDPGEPDPGYIHFWHTPNHWLEWSVDGAAAGQYEVTVRYAGKYNVRRSLMVNGEAVKGLTPFVLSRTGRWSTWREATLPTKVMLRSGRNVLRMTCLDEASVRMSDITLTASGQEPIAIKASAFSGQGGGRVQVLSKPTHGYFTGMVAREKSAKEKSIINPHKLEWTADAPEAGGYRVDLYYSADGYCHLEMQAGGKPVQGLEGFILPYTGDDTNFTVGTLPVAVSLKKGKNTLSLAVLSGERRIVPTVNGGFGLSVIRLVPMAEGDTLGDNVLALTTADRLKRPGKVSLDIPPAPLGPPLPTIAGAVTLEAGQTLDLEGLKATITEAATLPYVENKFSKRFVFANYDNERLRQFREKYKLDEVIAGGKDEFEKQAMLMTWVYDQWDFGHGQERYNLKEPFEILDEARKEHKFQCMHSGAVLQTAANSLGWVGRQMAIPSHTFNEIWSNQHRKWVQFDATSNYFPEKAGVPLNTYEQRMALLRDGGGVMKAKWGDGVIERKAQRDSYGKRLLFIGYIPNTNNLVRGPMYGRDGFFITRDEYSGDRKWHTRDNPEDPATEPYFPINQAALALVPDGKNLRVTIGTMTPNFKEFRVRIDGGEWKASEEMFTWTLHVGENRIEARSVNKFDIEGPVSTVVVNVAK
jgi:hypothetical protein